MPTGNSCCVATCNSQSAKAKATGSYIKFFTFPKAPKIRKQWVMRCYRKDKINPDTGRICSKHFTIDDYEDAIKAKLMNIPPKKLKKAAIPTLHLLPTTEDLKCRKPRKYVIEKERMEIINELLEEEALPSTAGSVCSQEEDVVTQVVSSNIKQKQTSCNCEILNKKCYVLESSIRKLEIENKTLQTKVQTLVNQMSISQQKNDSLKRKVIDFERHDHFEKKVKNLFRDVLTPNQIDVALKNKKKVWWTREELSRAFTLCYFSKKSYVYLKDQLNYPLPGLSTLRKWAVKMNLNKNVFEDDLIDDDSTDDESEEKIVSSRFEPQVCFIEEIKDC